VYAKDIEYKKYLIKSNAMVRKLWI